ncbi:MAG: hypothetical protein A2Y15_01120 [Clostridiales bacterium GWF2_36_10]|nr:MAG: hypothetical protein A2Y15_01120 [Clostridiales bacterium GWF2_36_10]HAN20136.1 hypothetical protein [Clostridiales bacterium]
MKKLFMLSLANISKTKGHTVSILIMFIITALLLNAGLLVFLNFGSYFEKLTEELNTSDVYYSVSSNVYTEEIDSYIKNHDNTLKMQKEENLSVNVTIPYNGGTRECSFLFKDAEKEREISKWKLVSEHLEIEDMSIYVPYVMSIDGSYKLNDKMEMTINEKVYTFTVKGFIDDAFFSSLDTGILGVYMLNETYEYIAKELGDKYKYTVVFSNLKESNKDVETGIREILKNDSKDTVSAADNDLRVLDLPLVRLSRVFMSSIMSVMMVAFSIIIAIVCLIVVRFRIGNSIEEDMTKIGSLKAIGYTSKQIMLSIVIQFCMIAIAGAIIGIAASNLATPVLSDVFAHQSGLKWVQGFDGVISSISLSFVLLVVIIVSYIAAGRIRKLNPIVALRGGLITHSFRKNHIPLHKSIGSIPVVLAFKSIFQNMKHSIMIGIIFIAVSFAGAFAVAMYYNTSIDTKAFAETPGIELSNAMILLDINENTNNIVENIRNMDNVRKAEFLDETMIKIDNIETIFYVMDDYSKKETNTIYEGRYPLHSNEVVLSGHLSKMLNKNIGESVTLNFGDKQEEYIVTGLSQGANRGGYNASVRLDGIIKIYLDYKQQNLQVYLNDDVKSDEFIKEVENIYGEEILNTVDVDKEMEQGMGVYVSIVSKVGIAMLVITIVVAMLVLYFVINSSVVRKKRELGIQKAIGFTTLQLMNQLSIGLLPPITIGVSLGCILGITETNVIMTMAQRTMGIMKANFLITPVWVALFGILIITVSYITSMLITYRIRKISAYALVSE